MFGCHLSSSLEAEGSSSRLTATGILIFIKIMTGFMWEVNVGIVKGLNVEQYVFVPIVSGQIRLGLKDSDLWSPARTTLGRAKGRWSEGSRGSVPFAGAVLFTSNSPCRNVRVCLQPVLWQGR